MRKPLTEIPKKILGPVFSLSDLDSAWQNSKKSHISFRGKTTSLNLFFSVICAANKSRT
jgi:hypothetical protein